MKMSFTARFIDFTQFSVVFPDIKKFMRIEKNDPSKRHQYIIFNLS